jgi:hypothetical protein
MNTKFKTQLELIEDIGTKIEKTAFKYCYWRRDPEIVSFAILHPFVDMAFIAASLVEGAPRPGSMRSYFENRMIQSVPAIHKLMADCNNPASPDHAKAIEIKKTLEEWMDLEVRAFYCPPCYFVQFTGQKWY